MLVVSIQGDFSEAKKEIDLAAERGGQAVELRLDLMRSLTLSQIAALRERSSLPVIFKVQTKGEGDRFEKRGEMHFVDLLRLGPNYVDIEYGSKWVEEIPPQIKTILSYHNFEKTPEDLKSLLNEMRRFPAEIYKIATLARSSIDALRMLSFVQSHSKVAGMCLGDCGALTRILAPVVKNSLTYTFLEKKTAPGQLSLSELITLYRYPHLNPQTKIYGVIGDPLDQSLGPYFHNPMFERFETNSVYVKIPLKESELAPFFSAILSLPFSGLSVTMPLKESVMPHLDAIDFESKKMRAVNTLIKKEEGWIGTNTDGKGALDALEKKKKVSDQTVLILGSGATARAIAGEAAKRGARVIVSHRTFEKAQKIAAQIQGRAIFLHQVETTFYDIVINATSVGMAPHFEEKILSEKQIRANALGLDVVICPKITPFLRAIQAKGGTVVFGWEMYVEQALQQLSIWSIFEKKSKHVVILSGKQG